MLHGVDRRGSGYGGNHSTRSYSLCLVPAGEPGRRLAAAIRRLGRRHGGPVFQPHVTLLGGIRGNPETILSRFDRLVALTPRFEVRLAGVGFRNEYFRALYLRAAPTPGLQGARRRARRLFATRRTTRFMGHLSLYYGLLKTGVKRRIASGIGESLDLRFDVAAIDLVMTVGEPADWRRVRRLRLRPLGVRS